MESVSIRTFRPGDASFVSYLHMTLYRDMFNFNGIFEYYVMKGLSEFLLDHEGGEMWVAELDGNIVGSIAAVKSGEGEAQLRWFILDEKHQGLGIGKKLFRTLLDFCKNAGYRCVFLWTVDMLAPARHLYQSHGFRVVEEKPNTEWIGTPITEERWELVL